MPQSIVIKYFIPMIETCLIDMRTLKQNAHFTNKHEINLFIRK